MSKSSLADPVTLFAPHLSNATGIIVAVSGGPDSMALMHLLAQWRERPRLVVATVDHGLRAEAASEAALVANHAQTLGLAHTTLFWRGSKPLAGIQEAAREARYRLLVAYAHETDCSHLATAHHLDDQAETVLLRLLSGSGIAGLAAMRAISMRDGIHHIRPLLGTTKAELVAACEANAIPFVTDPSNHDDRYGRTRMRSLMQTLAADGLTADRLSRLSMRAARANTALEDVALRLRTEATLKTTDCLTQIDWNMVSLHPAEIRLRVLVAVIDAARDSVEPMRLERLETLEMQVTDAHSQGLRLRRSIADRIVTLQSNGRLSLGVAPPRKRGVR